MRHGGRGYRLLFGRDVSEPINVIVFVNPMVPIRNDRTRICIPAVGGGCARLSEKGVGWIGEQAMRLMRAHSLATAIAALRSNPRVDCCISSPAAMRCNFSCTASCRSRPAASCWNTEGIPVVASSQVPAQRFYQLVTPARAPQIIRSRRAMLARPYKARHPIRKRTAGHRDRCETFFSLRTSKPHTKPLLRRRKK